MADVFEGDDDLAFWETMGQEPEAPSQEAASVEETTAEVEVAEEAPVEEADNAAEDARPRDEKGRFVSTKEESEEETVEEQAERLLAGNFNSVEDLERAYEELRSRFGQQGNELGELRRIVEERFATLEQGLNRPQAPSNWDDLIDEDPARATMIAYEQGDQFALQRAAQAWNEVAPGAPALWAENVRLREEFNSRMAQIEQTVTPVAKENEDAKFGRAFNQFLNDKPDFDAKVPQMQEIAQRDPYVQAVLQSNTVEAKLAALDYLYTKAGGGRQHAENLKQTAAEIARTAAMAEQKAIEEAAVASATTVQTEAPKKTAADLIGEEWDAIESPYTDGWLAPSRPS